MPSRTARALPKSAEKVLDCPGLVDDYYLNLLDWSSTNVVTPPPPTFPIIFSHTLTQTSLTAYYMIIDTNRRLTFVSVIPNFVLTV